MSELIMCVCVAMVIHALIVIFVAASVHHFKGCEAAELRH